MVHHASPGEGANEIEELTTPRWRRTFEANDMSVSWRIKSLRVLLLCMLGLLAAGETVAQGQAQAAAVRWSAAAGSEQHPTARAQSGLDGCLTSDGLMPKLTLFHSGKIYRLEARAGLLTESPLTFANNFDALVHVTGHVGPLADMYDPHHFPVFIINTIDKLAPTCDVKVSVGQLGKQLEKSKATAGTAPSAARAQLKAAVVVDMTGELLVFEPAVIEIRAGQTVTWKNSSGREVHTVTADPRQAASAEDVQLPTGAQPFDSGYMNPGQTYQHTFRKPGTYRYVCTLHEVQRMIGQVVVKP
jgi:plastocyanin